VVSVFLEGAGWIVYDETVDGGYSLASKDSDEVCLFTNVGRDV
jgi:hypothetical protein